MFERLEQTEARYEELTHALALPETMNDSAKFQKTAKAHSEISSIVEKYREYKDLTRGIAESKAVLADEKDAEMRAYAQEELDKLEKQVIELKGEKEDHGKGEQDDEDRGPKHHRHHDQEDKD